MKERTPIIECLPSNRQFAECDYYPNCHRSKHHILPRRLAKIAIEAGAGEEYVAKLRKAINHPLNLLDTCRKIHDDLDRHTSDELPSEEYLERYQP